MQLAISRNSVVFKVARYGGLYAEDQADLCSVFWCFLWGLLRAPFFVALGGVAGALIGFLFLMLPAIVLLVWHQTGILYGLDILVAEAIGWAVLGFIGYSFWAIENDKRNAVADAASSTVNLVKAGYRGWKDKTCVLVEVR